MYPTNLKIMLKKGMFFIVSAGLCLTSCIDHEVIPAPVPQVELEAHFIGNVAGSTVELTENVNDYLNTSSVDLYISQQQVNSTAVYFSTMSSPALLRSVSVGLGSVYWDATNGETRPTLPEFNNFYSSPTNQVPPYFDNGTNGFVVRYTDGNGTQYSSKQDSPNFQDVSFVNVTQESGENGDFNLFTCDFNCYVYTQDGLDSIAIQNATFKGWFKR